MSAEKKSLEELKKKAVRALISLTLDTEMADEIGKEISQFDFVEDVLLLTGDVDMMVKAHFDDYDHMKKFLTIELTDIEGVEDPTSMMIVSSYKERNKFLKAENPESEKEKE
ncbi:MAG: Lrp/AsnC ligand binding domain-containing protein [Candidatus Thermoplasmatota archaeon]